MASAQPPRRRLPGDRARTGNKVSHTTLTQRIIIHHAHYYQYCMHHYGPIALCTATLQDHGLLFRANN